MDISFSEEQVDIINKILKKNECKKTIIYGAGAYAKEFFDKFDISKLNIIAVADIKFFSSEGVFSGIKGISPYTIGDLNPELVLICIKDWDEIEYFLQNILNIGSETLIETLPI